ncbi:hypothetical protein FRB90_004780 [Tulasnella sp. 427]|nr:hypothetical protein FRB90_004780 [Tulasnella sp. 427]
MDSALPTASTSNLPNPNEAARQSASNQNEEPPSSFPRAPQTPAADDADLPPSSPDSPTKKKRGKAGESGVPEDPVDQRAVAQANLAAAPIVGVVGYGPGTGGGSGIRRHTPSCDFCKRRKERCVGGPPCQTCANRSLECTFDLVNKSHFDRKRTKKPSADDLGAPILPLAAPPRPAKPVEKVPRKFAKRENVSELACMFCRERRKKCSAERPTCLNCHRRGVECVYSDQPRARKGGRKRKDGATARNQADGGGEGSSVSAGALNGGSSATGTMALPGMLMPLPFLSPLPCHFCRGQDLPCDRNFPGCSNCHRKAQPCTYDPFTPDTSQLGIWPAAVTLPGAPMPFPLTPGAQVTNPSLAAQQAAMAAALPYLNVAWLAQLAALQQQTGSVNPASMNPMSSLLPVLTAPNPLGNTDGNINPAATASSGSANIAPPSMVSPPGYDPVAVAAAFAQAQAAAQVAAVAQLEPVVERSNAQAANKARGVDGGQDASDSSPEHQPEDADGEDDEDLNYDDLSDLQPEGKGA